MATTLANLRARARSHADMETASEASAFVTATTLTQWVNDGYFELYDLLLGAYGEDWFVTSGNVTIASGNTAALTAVPWYKLIGVDHDEGGGKYTAMARFPFRERNSLTDDNATGTYRLWYVPKLTALVNDVDVIAASIDGLGWDEYIAVYAAIQCRVKEESDASDLRAQLKGLRDRIELMSHDRDVGEPNRVVDVHGDTRLRDFTRLSRYYRVLGNTLHVYTADLTRWYP